MFKSTKEASPSAADLFRNIDQVPEVQAAWGRLEATRAKRDAAHLAYIEADKAAHVSTVTGYPDPADDAIAAAHRTIAAAFERAGLPVPPPPPSRADLQAYKDLQAAEGEVEAAERGYKQALREASPQVCAAWHQDRLAIQRRLTTSIIETLESFTELENLDSKLKGEGLTPCGPWKFINFSTLPTFPELLRKSRASGQSFQRNNKSLLSK